MPKPILLLTALAVIVSGAHAQDKKPGKPDKPAKSKILTVGAQVPADLALTDLNGKSHRFGDYRGKVVFVHFWSIRCPWEKYAEPKIQAIADRYADKGVLVLAINSNQNEIGPKPVPAAFDAKTKSKIPPYAPIRSHVQSKKLTFDVLVDHGNSVSKFFQARTTPHCYVIDRLGVLRYQGALDDDAGNRKPQEAKRYVSNAIAAVLEGKPVKVESSRPYG